METHTSMNSTVKSQNTTEKSQSEAEKPDKYHSGLLMFNGEGTDGSKLTKEDIANMLHPKFERLLIGESNTFGTRFCVAYNDRIHYRNVHQPKIDELLQRNVDLKTLPRRDCAVTEVFKIDPNPLIVNWPTWYTDKRRTLNGQGLSNSRSVSPSGFVEKIERIKHKNVTVEFNGGKRAKVVVGSKTMVITATDDIELTIDQRVVKISTEDQEKPLVIELDLLPRRRTRVFPIKVN